MVMEVLARPQPSESDIRQALRKVAQSEMFIASPRLSAFLCYIVHQALAGAGGRIKGYTIAVEALGRAADFDPRVDPIVRVEAGRLRRRLDRYYADEGADDPVVIELPLGGYVPRFHPRALSGVVPSNGHVRELRPAAYHEATTSENSELAALDQTLASLLSVWRLHLRVIAVEVTIAERMLERSLSCMPPPEEDRSACRAASRLLPTAPCSCEAAAAADEREDQQAQGAAAARPRRPRSG